LKDKNALAYHEPEKFYSAELWKRREPTARLIIKGEEREREREMEWQQRWRERQREMMFAGNTYLSGRISTFNLRVLTSLDHLILILNKYFFSFTKQAVLIRRSTVPSLPLQ
jgi:hypothetical protein